MTIRDDDTRGDGAVSAFVVDHAHDMVAQIFGRVVGKVG